jgi:hypothetical protein
VRLQKELDVWTDAGIPKAQVLAALASLSATIANDSSTADEQFETLTKYGTDLTAAAAKLDPVIGRDEEVRRVIRILSRRTKNNPILVGEPGVGKTAIVEGAPPLLQRCGSFSSELPEASLFAHCKSGLVDHADVSVVRSHMHILIRALSDKTNDHALTRCCVQASRSASRRATCRRTSPTIA